MNILVQEQWILQSEERGRIWSRRGDVTGEEGWGEMEKLREREEAWEQRSVSLE